MDEATTSQSRPNFTARQKRASLALWAVPGVGPRMLDAIRGLCDGDLGALLEVSPSEWFNAPGIRPEVRANLAKVSSLEQVAAAVEARAYRASMQIAWQCDPEYPERLLDVSDAPPVLFYRGSVGGPRRRLAMVGSRHVQPEFLVYAQGLAAELARHGAGVVSGGAIGVDRACHLGALAGAGETWAFLGAALDQLDPAQEKLGPSILHGGGVLFSELPPGVRASTTTFPRRNRLISGASDVVLVLRAGPSSGALHTARAAVEQKRPLLACPADPTNAAAEGTNELIHRGWARSVHTVAQLCEALGLGEARRSVEPPSEGAAVGKVLDELSELARSTYLALPRASRTFEQLLEGSRLEAAALTSALCELELYGLVLQRPGKVYEKI